MRITQLRASALVLLLALSALVAGAETGGAGNAPEAAALPYKLVNLYNFMFSKNVDEVIEVMKKAAKAGYTGIALTDCKFARWFETVTVDRPAYDVNIKRLRQACRDLNLKFYVFACDFGADLLSNDPNLAEGSPVIDAPFVVKNGALVAVDDDAKPLNPSFESSNRPDQPTGWNVDDPGSVCFLDTEVKYEGAASLRIQDIKGKNAHGNGRATQQFAVKPFRYYHLSVMVKTQDFVHVNTFAIYLQGMQAGKLEQGLMHQQLSIKPTQDWTKIDMVFNTLASTEVSLRIGSWGGQTGKLWIDDFRIEPAG